MAIRMTCDGAAKPFVCLGIYAPNIPREQQLFWEGVTRDGPRDVKVMLGDFNMVERPGDRNPPHADNQVVVAKLQSYLREKHLMLSWHVTARWSNSDDVGTTPHP